MNLSSLLQNNISAIISLCGVVIGVIFGALLTYFIQSRQHKWILIDQYHEWYRNNKQEKFKIIFNWSDQCLKTMYRLQEIEREIIESRKATYKFRREYLDNLGILLRTESDILGLTDATIYPIIVELSDTKFSEYFDEINNLRRKYINLLTSNQLIGDADINRGLFSSISEMVANMHRRSIEIIEKTFIT